MKGDVVSLYKFSQLQNYEVSTFPDDTHGRVINIVQVIWCIQFVSIPLR
jgi:hypothetical protein